MASRKAFVLERFFDGPVSGWGFTHSRLGKLQNHFTIDAEGKWDPALKKLELVEAYTFSDGHKDTLRWEIDKNAPHRYIGTEPRLKGGRWVNNRDSPSDGATAAWFLPATARQPNSLSMIVSCRRTKMSSSPRQR